MNETFINCSKTKASVKGLCLFCFEQLHLLKILSGVSYKNFFSALLLVLLVLARGTCVAQDDEETGSDRSTSKRSKLRVGLYVGTLFPASSSASIYDGWGYDIYGNRNDFSNSFMNRSINYVYGGNVTGQHDYIADALGVSHGEWTFDESDMPSDITYSIAFVLGAHAGFSIDGKNSIVFNFSSAKLTTNGAFTITVINTSPQSQLPGYQDIRTFGIEGSEQRSVFQLGLQHIFGEEGGFNFFAEGGAVCTVSKFLKNQIAINSLTIDLGNYYSQPQYGEFRKKNLLGTGFGVWTGCGFTSGSDARTIFQFVYNPSMEVIAIRENSSFSLQHYIGVRIYYNIWRRTVVKESF